MRASNLHELCAIVVPTSSFSSQRVRRRLEWFYPRDLCTKRVLVAQIRRAARTCSAKATPLSLKLAWESEWNS